MTPPPTARRAWATLDAAALAHNASLVASLVAPSAMCAVVKAGAYGHGAAQVARAALRAGARWLAVATVEEGVELRDAGICAPVLLLSEPPVEAMEEAVASGLTPTIYSAEGVAAAERAAKAVAAGDVAVHLKVDTGMHRVGAPVQAAPEIAGLVASAAGLRLAGLWTHLALADEPADPFTAEQLARFEQVRAALAAAGWRPALVHAANSAGAIAHPASRYEMVRVGIALYGYAPSAEVARTLGGGLGLRPVLSLRSRVAAVRELAAGERVSYGLRRPLPAASVVATVPIGYADGVPRRLFEAGMHVLIGGERRPLAGVVTMDQLMVDCGPGSRVQVGDEVVLIGEQGSERVSAEDWAGALGTISYEVLCGIGPRVARILA